MLDAPALARQTRTAVAQAGGAGSPAPTLEADGREVAVVDLLLELLAETGAETLGGAGGARTTPLPAVGTPATGANEQRDELRALERRVDKLTLVCMAMWAVMREEASLTDAELVARLREVEASLQAAGPRKTLQCPSCARATPRRHARCLYCGAECGRDDVFDDTL